MTNNIKLSARKTSFILAVSCILFSVIATYLYINHQIDLTRYTTPIILGTVVIIITCGGLQRVFYIFLTDECPQIFSDNQRNSIPDKVIPKPDMIIEECNEPTVEVSDIEMIEVSNATEVISMIELPEKTKNTDTTENKAVSSEIVTSITISEQHDDSKEIKVLEQQPTSEVKPEAFSYLQGFESLYEYNQCRLYKNGKFDMLHGQDETILPCLAMGGAQGGIGGTTNYNGKELTGIIEAWKAGDLELARERQNFAQEVINVICHYRGNIVGGKRIMKLIGLDLGKNRTPFQNMTDEEEAAMKAELEAINFFERCNK